VETSFSSVRSTANQPTMQCVDLEDSEPTSDFVVDLALAEPKHFQFTAVACDDLVQRVADTSHTRVIYGRVLFASSSATGDIHNRAGGTYLVYWHQRVACRFATCSYMADSGLAVVLSAEEECGVKESGTGTGHSCRK
jgi:hypothetical protein